MSIKSSMSGWFTRFRKQRPDENAYVVTQVPQPPVVPGPDLEPHPYKPRGLLSFLPGAKRDAAIAELRKGYGEVIELIRSVRTHMDHQAERGDRLLDIMERLPAALQALPETNRNQVRMLEAFQVHLEQHSKQSVKLNEAILSMATATRHQSQVLETMQSQIEAARENDQQRFESMNMMNSTLGRMSVSSDACVETLRHIYAAGERSDDRMEQLIERNARHMTVLTIACGAMILIAIGMAACVVWMLNK